MLIEAFLRMRQDPSPVLMLLKISYCSKKSETGARETRQGLMEIKRRLF